MKKKLIDFLRSDQFRELFLYVIIGGLTTVVSYVTYWAATRLMLLASGQTEVGGVIATAGTVVSHAFAIVFAFVTNKTFVFRTPEWRGSAFWHEAWTFTTARLLSLVLDLALINLAVEVLHMNDMIAKLIIQVIIVAANYLASKFWVFKKKADR